MRNLLILGASVCFLCTSNTAWSHDANNFCLVPIKTKTLSGDVTSKKRGLQNIIIFDNLPYLYTINHRMPSSRLNGYEMEERDDLPRGILRKKQYFYDEDKNIYFGSYPSSRKAHVKLNLKTGLFQKVSEEDGFKIKGKTHPIFYDIPLIGKDNQHIDFNRNDHVVYLDGKKIAGVYAPKFSGGKMLLARPRYIREFKEIFVTGAALIPNKYLPFIKLPETGTFTWKDNKWVKITHNDHKNLSYRARAYSDVLDKIFVLGTRVSQHVRRGEIPKIETVLFHYDRDGKLGVFTGEKVEENPKHYDLNSINKVVIMDYKNIYIVDENMKLSSIKKPASLSKSRIKSIIKSPVPKLFFILADNGIYTLDEDLNISPQPIFDMALFKQLDNIYNIPVRNETFVRAAKGLFLIVDRNLSPEAPCHD